MIATVSAYAACINVVLANIEKISQITYSLYCAWIFTDGNLLLAYYNNIEVVIVTNTENCERNPKYD